MHHHVAALVAPAADSEFDNLELADLSAGERLATAANAPALSLADIRDAVGDPLEDTVHLVTGTHYRSYDVSVTGTTAETTEKQPRQILEAGKDYRWIGVQP
jgi:hypothetical protein